MKIPIGLCLALLLAACHHQPLYQAASRPLPPAPKTAKALDLSAYPPAPIDYGHYQTWGWADAGRAPSAVDLEEAVQSGLDQRGLRPARRKPPDLLVSVSLQPETRYRAIHSGAAVGYGYYPGRHWHHHGHRYYPGYALGAGFPITEAYQPIQVEVLRLQLRDAHGQSLWSGRSEISVRGSAGDRRQRLFKAVGQALRGYPPG